MKLIYLKQVKKLQDKYIKKHQETLEVMREEVRDRKQDILDKIDLDEMMLNPKEYLTKISTEFYNSNKNKLQKSFDSGKNLAKNILKKVK